MGDSDEEEEEPTLRFAGDELEGEYEEEEAAAAMAAKKKEPEALSEQWVNTRFNQTCMHLKKLARDRPGMRSGLISEDEKTQAEAALQAALAAVLSNPEGAKKLETASAVFWAIVLARDVAAKRPEGWVVDQESAAEEWDEIKLWRWLSNYKGESTKTAEKEAGGATRVGRGLGRALGGMGDVAKTRKLRVDSLGDLAARDVWQRSGAV